MQAIKVLNMIKLFGKAIRVNKASQDKDTLDVGANLFIGNLDPDVDEKVLTFPSSCIANAACLHARSCNDHYSVYVPAVHAGLTGPHVPPILGLKCP